MFSPIPLTPVSLNPDDSYDGNTSPDFGHDNGTQIDTSHNLDAQHSNLLANNDYYGDSYGLNHDSHSLDAHQHFDPNHPHGIVIGNPTEEMSHWHEQISSDACGIATQQSAIEHINHQSYSQEELLNHAQENHWYSPHRGTPAEDFGKLITEQTHVPVESHYHGTIDEIATKLSQHEEVFVGVSADIINLPDRHSMLGQAAPDLFDPHHYQGAEANHIVQAIGVEIDPINPHNSVVIVNDSSSPDGRGLEIPLDQFQEAMNASHGYIASTEIHHNDLNDLAENHHSMAFRGCDDYGFDSYRKNFYVDGDIRGHCDGNKIYTHRYPTISSDTYKGCIKDMNIYDAKDNKVGYLDGCGNVHTNDGKIVLSGQNHSGFANAAYYLLNLVG
jgi:hypothetical protein